MLNCYDLKTDESDDIIFFDDDIEIEYDSDQTALDVAGRRICGRLDDTPYRINLCAGLERFLFSNNIERSKQEIVTAINECLIRDKLFMSSEFKITIGDSYKDSEAKLYIIFNMPNSISKGFKIFVDVENQRVFKQ